MRTVPVVSLLLLLGLVSCSTVQTQQDPSKPPPPETTVEVRNQKPLDFTMYVMNETTRIRLGLVPGMSTRVFTIPAHLINDRGQLRFQADTIGSDAVMTTDEEYLVITASEPMVSAWKRHCAPVINQVRGDGEDAGAHTHQSQADARGFVHHVHREVEGLVGSAAPPCVSGGGGFSRDPAASARCL